MSNDITKCEECSDEISVGQVYKHCGIDLYLNCIESHLCTDEAIHE